MKLGKTTLAASTIAAALVVLVPTTATAATYTSQQSAGGALRATAKFNQSGDVYTIKDEYSDGKSAILFKSDLQSSGYYAESRGAGYTRTIDTSLPNGSQVGFAACYGEASNVTGASCAATRYVTA